MDIIDIDLKKIKPDGILLLFNAGEIKSSKTGIKKLNEEIVQSIRDGRFIIALNACVLGILIAPEQTIATIRRGDLFRYSTYIVKKMHC